MRSFRQSICQIDGLNEDYIKLGCLRRRGRRRYFVRHCSRVILADSPLTTPFLFLLATQVIGAKRAEEK